MGHMSHPNRQSFTITHGLIDVVAIAGLLAVTFLVGGSSRADYLPSIVVMAVSAGYVGAVAPFVTKQQLRPIAVPLGLLGGVFLLCLAQLVPFPTFGNLGAGASEARRLVAETSALAGVPGSWRPLSLSPVATWSSLVALFVPAAMLIALARLPSNLRRFVMPVLLVAALGSALLGVVQSLAGAESALYYYEFTNRGEPVGVFANRNHQAVFLACGVLWAAYVYVHPPGRPDQAGAFQLTAGAMSIVLFCCVLLNASRAGLIALSLAMIFASMMLIDRLPWAAGGLKSLAQSRRGPGRSSIVLHSLALPGVALLSVGCLIAVFFFQSKIPGFNRVLTTGSVDDLRSDVTPTLIDMAWQNLPWGTGMGTFERVYRVAEPDALLMPSYFNNAHNDWLQLAIEGGVPAMLLLGGVLAWIVVRLVDLVRMKGAETKLVLCIGGSFVIMTLASAVDYPLRTPWMMAVVALLIGLLAFSGAASHAKGQASLG